MVHVILVERNEAARELATAALLESGHHPIALSTAAEAVRIARFVRVDALVAETAPFGGPYLADEVRRFHPNARIILMSARWEFAAFLFRAKREGWHLVPRPYRMEEILTLLN